MCSVFSVEDDVASAVVTISDCFIASAANSALSK